jgi:hypothetical protein
MPRAHPPTLNNRNTGSSRRSADSPGAGSAITIDSSDSSDNSEAEEEWPIKSILRETDTQYLIDWEGPYEPSWVSRIARLVPQEFLDLCAELRLTNTFFHLGTQRKRQRTCC